MEDDPFSKPTYLIMQVSVQAQIGIGISVKKCLNIL